MTRPPRAPRTRRDLRATRTLWIGALAALAIAGAAMPVACSTNAGPNDFPTDSTGSNIADVNSIRVSLGAGMSGRSPFGPVRISLAQAVLKESFDRTGVLRFSFGSRF